MQKGDLTSLFTVDTAELVRDQFNTRKLIVAVTKKGKVGRGILPMSVPLLLLYVAGVWSGQS